MFAEGVERRGLGMEIPSGVQGKAPSRRSGWHSHLYPMQPIKAANRLRDYGGMQGWVDL